VELSAALEMPLTGERPRLDRDRGHLLGSRCASCGATSWPARAICNRCGSAAIEGVALARTGTLLTYTEVWVERPGLQPPYILGQVELDDGPLIFTHVRRVVNGRRVPLPVEVVIGEEDALPAFWVEPYPPPGGG
jgi:uncharacterized OB-fold protein